MDGVGVAVGRLVTRMALGLDVACGCTKIWMVVPVGFVTLADGFWLHTVPAVTGWLAGAGVITASTLKPCAVRICSACGAVSPMTDCTAAPPPEMYSVICWFGSTWVPCCGDMWSTSPCGSVDCASGWVVTLLRPTLASFCCAAADCMPVTLGTWIFWAPEET